MDAEKPKKVTATAIRSRKSRPEKLVAITAYDYTFAKLVDDLVDVILVGDSLGMVIQGNPNTLSVTLEDIIYHTRAVSRAVHHSHLVADMPFMSYQTGEREAIRNAGRLISEGGAEAVKLEGGTTVAEIVQKLVGFGIPVLGHIGLTPQSIHAFGGYKIQGKTERERDTILQDAIALEDAGAYAIVLEGMPSDLAKSITERIRIPTIGIGAGPFCDGQVLVIQDLLGLNPDFKPRFVKTFTNLSENITGAVKEFAKEVREGVFPDENHSF